MLLERAKVLVRRTDEYRTKRALANDAERFATRAKQLGAPTAKLATLRALVREFLVAGVAAAVAKDDAWRHLSGSGIPDEVIDFLRQAGTSGFSLAKLTPAIQAWLGERDLLGTFRIRSAGLS